MTLATFINVTKYWRSICIDSIGYIWGAYWNNTSGNYEVAKSDTPMGSSFTVKYTTANTISKIIATSNDHIFILCQDGAKLRKWDGYTFDTFTAENAVAICRDNDGANYINTSTEIKKCVSGGTSYSAYIASCPTGFIDINAALTMYLATSAYGQKGIYKCAVDETEFTDISAGALDWNQILASRDGRKYAGIDSDQHLYRALAGSDTFAESLDTGSAGFYLCDDANGNIFAAIYDGVIKAIKYGVTYYGNGNTGGSAPVDANTYLAGSNATVAAAGTLVKAGSTFSHWNTAADGSGTSYNPADLYAMTTDDVALYAIWVIEEYSVTYDANTGTIGAPPTDSTVYHYEDPVTVKYNSGYLSKPGYSFDHWDTAADDSGTDYDGGESFNMPASNVTLYAQYVACTGEFPRLKTAATAVGLWTPTTGGTDAKTYYDASEALRTALYGADGLTGILSPAYIESTYEFATDAARDTFLKLWSDYDDAARDLQDAITTARETVSMTSLTAPTGLYTGQLGQYLGKRYRWSGSAWVSIDMAEPKPWASHDLAGLPEYPDDPAGTTYRNVDGWTTGVDGFNSDGTADISISDGKLKSNSKDSLYNYFLARRTITSISNGFVAMKVYCNFNGSINLRNGSTVATPFASASVTVGQTVYISGIASGAMTALYIDARPSVVPSVVTNYISIFDVYIGTGATLTPPIDNSGNGHHLTANALIPVVDATAPGGRYVKLSGQPSYMSGTLSGFTTALFLSFPFYLPAASTTAKVVAESSVDYTGQDGAWALIWNFGGTSGRLALVMRTASGEYLGGYCTPTASTWYYGAIQYNQADAAATALGLYLNGALQSLTSLYTGATRPAVYNGVHWFGARAGSSMFCDMRIGSPIVLLDYIPTQEENNWLAAGKPLNQKYSIADYRLYESAADGKITPQEKRTYWMPWAREKWDAVDVTATTPALASPSGLTVAGEYKTLVDAALSAGITVANATLVAYRTAWENCRAYFYATPFVLLSTYWDSTITVTTSTLMGYKSAYNAAADNLRALIASTRASTAQSTAIAAIPTYTPHYLGRYDHAHPASYNPGDWWTVYDTNDDPIQRGVWYSNAGTPERITTSSSVLLMAKLTEAVPDIAWAEANSYGAASDYGIAAVFQSLGVVTAFINALFACSITMPAGGYISIASDKVRIQADGIEIRSRAMSESPVANDRRLLLDDSLIVIQRYVGSDWEFASQVELSMNNLGDAFFGLPSHFLGFVPGDNYAYLGSAITHFDCTDADLGSATAAWMDLYFGGVIYNKLEPDANNTRDIGTSSAKWKDIYMSGVINSAAAVAPSSTAANACDIRMVDATERTTTEDDYTDLGFTSTIRAAGVWTVSLDMKAGSASGAYVKIYRNRGEVITAIGTERFDDTAGYLTYTEEFTFAKGDIVLIYGKSASTTAYAKNYIVCCKLVMPS
jgi:hypothetical protein